VLMKCRKISSQVCQSMLRAMLCSVAMENVIFFDQTS
jgi:hypothetical protein